MTLTTLTRLAAMTGVIAAIGAAPAGATSSRAAPAIDPGNFVRSITNPYLPYRPGTVYVYTGVKDGQPQRDVVRVTHRTRRILGVTATVVTDVATHAGTVLEQTTDWYAQDRQGNVWYLGEATKARNPDGTYDTSGSWLAGAHGARPGIVMTAHPRVGDAHRQEYWAGHAEDQYWLVDMASSVTVPARSIRTRRSDARVVAPGARRDRREVLRQRHRRGQGAGRERPTRDRAPCSLHRTVSGAAVPRSGLVSGEDPVNAARRAAVIVRPSNHTGSR